LKEANLKGLVMKYSASVSRLLFPKAQEYHIVANAILSSDFTPKEKFESILCFGEDGSRRFCSDEKGRDLCVEFPSNTDSTMVAVVYAATMLAHPDEIKEFFILTAQSVFRKLEQVSFLLSFGTVTFSVR